jgi:hypothetical protein
VKNGSRTNFGFGLSRKAVVDGGKQHFAGIKLQRQLDDDAGNVFVKLGCPTNPPSNISGEFFYKKIS